MPDDDVEVQNAMEECIKILSAGDMPQRLVADLLKEKGNPAEATKHAVAVFTEVFGLLLAMLQSQRDMGKEPDIFEQNFDAIQGPLRHFTKLYYDDYLNGLRVVLEEPHGQTS